MLLAQVADASRSVADARGKLAKIGLLVACLRALEPREIAIAVDYLAGGLRQGRIGLGWAILRDALGATSAAAAPSLTLVETDATFERIATTSGRGSATERRRLVAELFARATEAERDFLVRLVGGELRQGALEGVMVEAIAKAADVPAAEVRRAVMLCGRLAVVAEAALREGRAGLAQFGMRLLEPVQPMLAQTAEGVPEALDRLGRAAFEHKLDGARVQVHKVGDDVRIFTRALNDVTESVPEIVEIVRALPARELVLDGEAIALRDDGTPHPFQVTMRRFGRKLDVAKVRGELPLRPFFFDLLHDEAGDRIDETTEARFAALERALPRELLVPRLVTGDRAAASAFLEDAIARGHEGVMAKALDVPYEAGSRGSGWLKVKPAHTLDLVVLAAEWGHGRRKGWLSNLHLGARDPEQNAFVMLGKTFKGMTDEMLAWQTTKLLELEIAREEYTVHVRPELVVEIAFEGLQESPRYPGGLALRLARVKRYRTDKRAGEADTIATVRAIHASGRRVLRS